MAFKRQLPIGQVRGQKRSILTQSIASLQRERFELTHTSTTSRVAHAPFVLPWYCWLCSLQLVLQVAKYLTLGTSQKLLQSVSAVPKRVMLQWWHDCNCILAQVASLWERIWPCSSMQHLPVLLAAAILRSRRGDILSLTDASCDFHQCAHDSADSLPPSDISGRSTPHRITTLCNVITWERIFGCGRRPWTQPVSLQ